LVVVGRTPRRPLGLPLRTATLCLERSDEALDWVAATTRRRGGHLAPQVVRGAAFLATRWGA
jgi:hypothetical protein